MYKLSWYTSTGLPVFAFTCVKFLGLYTFIRVDRNPVFFVWFGIGSYSINSGIRVTYRCIAADKIKWSVWAVTAPWLTLDPHCCWEKLFVVRDKFRFIILSVIIYYTMSLVHSLSIWLSVYRTIPINLNGRVFLNDHVLPLYRRNTRIKHGIQYGLLF